MPYAAPKDEIQEEMYEFVAVDGATGLSGRDRPYCHLYSTSLRIVFSKLVAAQPTRSIIGLFNYCRSGGALQFFDHITSREYLGVDNWPLYLMSSSQPEHDALVGGLWDAYFTHLTQVLKEIRQTTKKGDDNGNSDDHGNDDDNSKADDNKDQLVEAENDPFAVTIDNLYKMSATTYFQDNRYELKDHICTLAFPSDHAASLAWRRDLDKLIAAGDGGNPDYEGLRQLQEDYRNGARFKGKRVKLWHPTDWGDPEVDLVTQVKEACRRIAIPDSMCGYKSNIQNRTIRQVFLPFDDNDDADEKDDAVDNNDASGDKDQDSDTEP